MHVFRPAAAEFVRAVVDVDACTAAARGASTSTTAATGATTAILFLPLIVVIACLLPSSSCLDGLARDARRERSVRRQG
jgi:hypothetical protein